MKKTMVLMVWLVLPVLVGFYHYGPGQQRMVLDDIDTALKTADRHADAEEWTEALAKYDEALQLMPAEKKQETLRVRLERAKAQMMAKQLPAAHAELKALVDELKTAKKVDEKLLAEARETLANSQYYMTWLMRLEGLSREQWEPEIEAARQTFKLLAEQAKENGSEKTAKRNQEDLESSIRLARMELTDLQGLPLPSQ